MGDVAVSSFRSPDKYGVPPMCYANGKVEVDSGLNLSALPSLYSAPFVSAAGNSSKVPVLPKASFRSCSCYLQISPCPSLSSSLVT